MKYLVITLLFLPLTGWAQQNDSLVLLGEVKIQVNGKNGIDAGKTRYSRQSAALLIFPTGSVADVLQATSPFHIKTYGAGMLSSVSGRGSGATHTPVLWNGINLQSSMNGQLDLSLLPAGFFNSIDLIPGGGSDLFGSGAIGGVIQLNNDNRVMSGWRSQALFSAGSFGKNTEMLSLGWGKKNLSLKVSGFRQIAENNYPYHNRSLAGNPIQVLNNARADAAAFMGESHIQLGKVVKLSLFAWYQGNERQVPPTMIIPVSIARQKDETTRTAAVWDFHTKKWNFIARNAFLRENLWYNDANISLFSSNKAYSLINEIEAVRDFGKLLLTTGFNSTENRAITSNYTNGSWKRQSRQALFAALEGNYLRTKGKWKLSARQELNDGKPAPLALSAGTDLQLKNWKLRTHLAKVYRLPNFNDQFWVPGGNPDILPENGYTAEAGTSWLREKGNSKWQASVTGFYNIIDNWIIWLPQNGYWTPTNLQQVHSRGAEWEADFVQLWPEKRHSLQLQYGGSLTFSSNEKAKSAGDVSVGKQLIYVPYWKNYFRLLYAYRYLTFSYSSQVTGARYTSGDNTSSLPAFHTGDMMVKYAIKHKAFTLSIFGAVRNVWDHAYEVIVWRPMPGRHFETGINLYYH